MINLVRLICISIFLFVSSVSYADCTIDLKFINGINNSEKEAKESKNKIMQIFSNRTEICSVELLYNTSYGVLNDISELEIGKVEMADDWGSKVFALIKQKILSVFTSDKNSTNYNANLEGMKSNVQASYDAGRKKVIIITHSQGAEFGKALRLHFQSLGKSIQVFYIAPPITLNDEPGCDKTKIITDLCYVFSTADNVISLVTDKPFPNFAATTNQINFLMGHGLLDYYLQGSSAGEWSDNTVYGKGIKNTNSFTIDMIKRGVGLMINHPPNIYVR